MTPLPAPRALVVINGDDVYEDLFSAGLKLAEILSAAGFAARTSIGTARLVDLAATDLLVLYTALGEFPPARQAGLAAAVRAGAGLLAVHAANVFPGTTAGPDPAYRIAHALIGSRFVSHGPPPHESRFQVESVQTGPVAGGTEPFGITHEHYQIETADDVEVIAWRRTRAGREPVAYRRQEGRGRVCYLQLGHDMRAWDDPPVREFVTRAARWAHGEETR